MAQVDFCMDMVWVVRDEDQSSNKGNERRRGQHRTGETADMRSKLVGLTAVVKDEIKYSEGGRQCYGRQQK